MYRIENKELPYHAFSFGENRQDGNGLKDNCILYKARAKIIDLSSGAAIECSQYHKESLELLNKEEMCSFKDDSMVPVLCIELVGNRFLRKMVRKLSVR